MEDELEVKFKICCTWDNEAAVWYVSESNVPGLSGESATVEAMIELLKRRIPELMRLNMPELFTREAPKHIPFDLITKRRQELTLACS